MIYKIYYNIISSILYLWNKKRVKNNPVPFETGLPLGGVMEKLTVFNFNFY